jgi:hypothetical protein
VDRCRTASPAGTGSSAAVPNVAASGLNESLCTVYTGGTAFPDGGCLAANCVAYGRSSPPYFGLLELAFVDPLGSSGSNPIVGGAGGPSWENYSFSSGEPPIRYIASGVATATFDPATTSAVPEPAIWAMIVLGFAGLGFAGYRKTKITRTAFAA